MCNNTLAHRMEKLIRATGFWEDKPIHVQIGGAPKAYLRRQRPKEPRQPRRLRKVIPHVYMVLPPDWIETVYQPGLATACQGTSEEPELFVLGICEEVVTNERLDALCRVAYAWKRGPRIQSREGWLARYGGVNVISEQSSVVAKEVVQGRFLAGLGVKSVVEQILEMLP